MKPNALSRVLIHCAASLFAGAAIQTNGGFAWAGENGEDANVVTQSASNEPGDQRMACRNNPMHQRQPVYLSSGLTFQAQQVVQMEQRIQQPASAGQELPVRVTKTDFEGSRIKFKL